MPFKLDYRLVPVRNVVVELTNSSPRKKRSFLPQDVFMSVLSVLLIFTIIELCVKIRTMENIKIQYEIELPVLLNKSNLLSSRDRERNSSAIRPLLVLPGNLKSQLQLVYPKSDVPGTPLWKRPTLLNLKFRWVMNNQSICRRQGNSSKHLVPVLVHTAREHFTERYLLRQTWLSIRDTYTNWDVRPVFLLGYQKREMSTEKEWEQLGEEQYKYGDLIMGNFMDTYRNLSYKHLMGYKWVLNYCSNASFVLKTDDDIFIDLYQWLDRQEMELKRLHQNRTATPLDMFCITFKDTWPQRDKNNKWYVSEVEWPKETFPDYCSGSAYGISVEWIRRLYEVSQIKDVVWVDDALATGILRETVERTTGFKVNKLDIYDNYTDELHEGDWLPFCHKVLKPQKRLQDSELLQRWTQRRPFKTVVAVSRDYPHYMTCLWNKVMFDRNVTTILKKIVTSQNLSHKPMLTTIIT